MVGPHTAPSHRGRARHTSHASDSDSDLTRHQVKELTILNLESNALGFRSKIILMAWVRKSRQVSEFAHDTHWQLTPHTLLLAKHWQYL